MVFLRKHLLLLLLPLFQLGSAPAQTLIINEVSNGPSGNKEYVELVVVDNTIVYDCNSTTPPCIDIRGWIFDDNSGYHGAGGVASGAVRFANNPLWACVPVGTIILIYNNGDPNVAVPANDLSTTDGNCVIIAPVASIYFDRNTSTPGAAACSYPATGWINGGDWTTTALANTGDCARIVDLSGCEVFSLCYGSTNANTLIYFNSGGSGAQNVWWFNDGDPYQTSNWSEGCAAVGTCGSDDQTPGAPNNAANAAYIGQFNNNCLPIQPLTLTLSNSTDAICGCTGSATVSASGSIGPYTYQWLDASFVSIGQNTAGATNLCAGNYQVIATSSINCAETLAVTINSSGAVNVVFNTTDVSCPGGSDGEATLSLSGGTPPYSINWSPAPSFGQGTGNASGMAGGNYTVTITDDLGCVQNTAVFIGEPSPLSANLVTAPITCNGACNGSINAIASGGTGTLSLSWSNGTNGSNISNLCAGNYSVTITDQNGCTATSTTLLTEPSLITLNLTATDAICGNNNGTASVSASGGAGNYSYIWFDDQFNVYPSTASINGLAPENYTVVVADQSGCSVAGMITVGTQGAPLLSENHSDLVCNNDNSGNIDLSITGTAPFQINWSGPGGFSSSTEDLSNLAAGTYTATVNDAANCPATISVTLTEPQVLQINTTLTQPLCGTGTGEILATATGGTGTIDFSIDGINFGASGLFTTLIPATYTVTAIDDAGCSASTTADILAPSLFNASATVTDAGCFGSCNGSVSLTITGTGPFAISWNGGAPGALTALGNQCAGNYSVSITNPNGCVIDLTGTIGEFPEINIASVSATDLTCHSICTGSIQINAPQATEFSIDGGITFSAQNSFSALCAGSYAVTVSDANGCTATGSVTLNEPPALSISFPPAGVFCENSMVNITPTLSGGTFPYSLDWGSGLQGSSLQFSIGSDTTVCVSVSDADGCVSPVECENFTVFPALAYTGPTDVVVCEGSSATLQLTLSGGNGNPYSTVWSDGSAILSSTTSLVVQPVVTTSYFIAAGDACSQSAILDTVIVTVLSNPVLQISADITSGCSPLTVNFSETTGSPGLNCVWTFGTAGSNDDCNSTSFTFSQPGCYDISYSLTNPSGCTGSVTSSQLICVHPDPIAAFTPSVNSVSSFSNNVEMANESTGGNDYLWTLNGNPVSSDFSPQLILPAETAQTHQVCLLVTNTFGCIDSTCRYIEAIPDLAVYVPNAFTPNADPFNKTFAPVIAGYVDEYLFRIFNRWGELIFESKTPGEQWDGTYKGIACPVDVYVWTLMVFVDNPGKEYRYKGHVTLIR